MFHLKAHQISSGKSFLCSLIAAFAASESAPASSFPPDEAECKKLLLSVLLASPPVLCFDNMTTHLKPYRALCSVLTEEFFSDRVLSVSKTATVGTRTLFLSSGNNVGPIGDMTRRCLTIHLDPACEVPAERTFVGNPVIEVRNNRGRYVALVLTIIRAWIVAGRPTTKCKTLASYTVWSDLVRQPLLWLGLPDPVQSVFESMAVDPDTETLGRLLTACKCVFGGKPTMVRDLVKQANRLSSDPNKVELYEVISDIADERGDINKKRLGWWIERHSGRIVDGLRFAKAPKTRNAVQWQVVSVSSVSSVPVSPPATSVVESDSVAELMVA